MLLVYQILDSMKIRLQKNKHCYTSIGYFFGSSIFDFKFSKKKHINSYILKNITENKMPQENKMSQVTKRIKTEYILVVVPESSTTTDVPNTQTVSKIPNTQTVSKIPNTTNIQTTTKATLFHCPLTIAAAHGNLETVIDLIAKGETIDGDFISDTYSATPLNRACRNGHVKVVEYLLMKGADPNYNPNMSTGYAPLLHTLDSKENVLEIVVLLFKYGAKLGTLPGFIHGSDVLRLKEGFFLTTTKAARLLMIAREKDVSSPFYKDNLPLDLFKLIYKMANLCCLNEEWKKSITVIW